MLYSVDRIGIRFPLGVQGDVPGAARCNLGYLVPTTCSIPPSIKDIAFFCCIFEGYSFVFNGVGFRVIFMIRSIIQLVGDAVDHSLPLSRYCNILCRHGLRYFFVPTVKGVTRLGRISRHCYLCAVILGDGVYRTAPVTVKGDGVLVNGVGSCYGKVVGYIAKVGIPFLEHISFSHGICRCSRGVSMFHCLRITYLRTIPVFKRYGIFL